MGSTNRSWSTLAVPSRTLSWCYRVSYIMQVGSVRCSEYISTWRSISSRYGRRRHRNPVHRHKGPHMLLFLHQISSLRSALLWHLPVLVSRQFRSVGHNCDTNMTASIGENWHSRDSTTGPWCSVNYLHVYLLTAPCRTSVCTNYWLGKSCVDERWALHTVDLHLNYGLCRIHWPGGARLVTAPCLRTRFPNNSALCGPACYSDDSAVAPVFSEYWRFGNLESNG